MTHLTEKRETQRRWHTLLAPYAKPINARAFFQLVTTGTLFVATWLLMLWSLQGPYWLTVLLALPAAGLLARLFMFQHDCGHGSFFSSARANDIVGFVIGVMNLVPYGYWRRTHAMHHSSSGNLDRRGSGDVRTWTVEEYRSQGSWGRIGYRLSRNPLVLLVVAPVWLFVIKYRLPLDQPLNWNWRREWASVMWTNLAIGAVIATAWATIGLKSFLLVQAPITLLSGALGVWLFYIQHQFEDTYWQESREWSFERAGIEGSSLYDLPRVLHWFTANIGFHHVHHLAAGIPNYRLAECFRRVRELHQVTRLTIRGSFACARLALWDEEAGKMVSFRQARQPARA